MRCIEIVGNLNTGVNAKMININMRCIEMLFKTIGCKRYIGLTLTWDVLKYV